MAGRFLLDANVFIQPHRTYFPVQYATLFWNQMATVICRTEVGVLDVVIAELTRSEDDLSNWIQGVHEINKISIRDPQILIHYSEIMEYIHESPVYSEHALRRWGATDYADPWLIAAAMSMQAEIVTDEVSAGGLSERHPSGNPKIPDVSKHFRVTCITPYDFTRQMGFKL